MVTDKYVKALDFMVNMKFTDSCIGYDAGEKKCHCLAQFLEDEINLIYAKNWNGIGEDDDENMMKEKVIDFLNPFHVVKNIK